jgi:hypothetical protein
MSDDRWPDRDEARPRHNDLRERGREERGRDRRSRPQPGLDRLRDERDLVRYRGHDYRLNGADVELLRTVGTFRAVYAEHLREDFRALDNQVRQLRDQGLMTVEHIQTPDTHRLTHVLTLTRDGHRLVSAGEEGEQRYHWGLVQPRELHHDAHLYCIVKLEEERAEARGAHVERVKTDDELEREWWSRELADLEPAERATQIGIGLDDDGRAVFPDVQIVIREADESCSRCNLELTTEHYAGRAMRAKAAAGFRMYGLRSGNSGGRGGDLNRDHDRWHIFDL